MPISDVYNFKERRFQALTHALKIYIFGEEVTQWLKGSVTVTYGNRDSYNTCNFDLSNPHRIFQLTEANLVPPDGEKEGIFRPSRAGEYSEHIKKAIFAKKNDKTLNPYFELDITAAKLGQKGSPNTEIKKPSTLVGTVKPNPPSPTQDRKWRLAFNDCIFNKHDTIRVFAKNPFTPSSNEWVEVYCGFVQEHPISTNYLTGESSVRISCYCIRQMMNKMRTQINTFVGQDPSPLFNTGFFRDLQADDSKVLSHAFANSSLENTIKELVLGTTLDPAKNISSSEEDKAKTSYPSAGVGGFRLGNVVCFDPALPEEEKSKLLTRWHLMTIFGVHKQGWPSGNPGKDGAPGKDGKQGTSLWLTSKEAHEIGRSTIPLLFKGTGGPDARFLHFLLPKSGTGAGNLVSYGVDTQPGSRDWATRWEVIREFASRLDFQVLVSPSGDLLVEFPQYAFTPSAYGALAPLLSFNLHQKEGTLNDEAEDFPTLLQVDGGVGLQPANTAESAQEQNNIRTYIFSKHLVARYGVIQETLQLPFVGQKAKDIHGNVEDSPIIKRMALLGKIDFTKRMADASSWSGSIVHRPFLFPNRPVLLGRIDRVALLTSVSHTWNIGVDASTEINVHQLMAKRVNSDGSQNFRLITGAINTPIDYGVLWGDDGVGGAGVHAKDDEDASDATDTDTDDGAKNSKKGKKAAYKVSGKSKAILAELYKPFADMVEAMLIYANSDEFGGNFSIYEGLRSAKKQDGYFKQDPPITKAEGWASYHQYGLAVDFISNEIKDEHGGKLARSLGIARLEEANIAVHGVTRLVWGGNWTSFYDPGHFQIPFAWQNKSEGSFIRGVQDYAKGRVEDGADEATIREEVQKMFLDSQVKGPNPVSRSTSKDPSVVAPADAKPESTTDTNVEPSPAPPCEERFLTAPGFTLENN